MDNAQDEELAKRRSGPNGDGARDPGRDGPEQLVEGRIVFEYGAPAGGMTLRLYNRGFGADAVQVGEARTDEQGFYALPYALAGKGANLELRALDANGEELSLSVTKFGAQQREVLNLVAPEAIRPLAPEYDRLAADLGRELGDLGRLADARENAERRDLTLLRQATRWDARLIALAAATARLSRETGMSPEVQYALARVGLPTDKQRLAQVGADVVGQALKKAQDAGIVRLDERQIAGARAAFERFAGAARLDEKAPGALSSLGELLRAAGASPREQLTEEEQRAFAGAYFAHRGEAAELWREVEAQGVPREKINGLRLQGKLAFLTLNNAALTRSLQQEIGSSGGLAQLVERDLHQSVTWKGRLQELARGDERQLGELIPPAYEGKTVADRLDAYAADLARKVRVSFPTQVVGRMVERGELRLGEVENGELRASVGAFLKKAQGLGFEMGRVPLATFVRENNVSVDEATLRGVKQLTRLYQITPSDEALVVLAREGFKSAEDIVAFPYEEFLARHGDKFPTLKEAELVHRKAQQVSAVTRNLVLMAKGLDDVPPIFALSAPPAERERAKRNLIKHYPAMESLFGALDFCECEHCRSVLSPAAYLVDLLQLLDPDQKVWAAFLGDWRERHDGVPYMGDWTDTSGRPRSDDEKTPFEALVERRPDLPHLPLTCENTNTLLPHIDVVNEILEYSVANGGLDDRAVHDDNGEATTPELLAEPQNVIAAAYDRLRDAQYPLALPFDLWLETVRRLCRHFETPLWQVLEAFRPVDDLFPGQPVPGIRYTRSAIFAEYLGISPAEYAIFTAPAPLSSWFGLYGFDAEEEALAELKSARALSRRLGVSYKELLELVGTAFVNPQLDRLVVLRKLGLDVEDVFRYKKHPGHQPFDPAEELAFEDRLRLLTRRFNPKGLPDGFDAQRWLDTAWPRGFERILVLAGPVAGCDFDQTTLRYADAVPGETREGDLNLVFLKMNLFVRLWRKLGWTMEETDRALQVFLPQASLPLTADTVGVALKTALVYLAHLEALDRRVKAGKGSRLKLLTLWSNLSTTGKAPLYAQLFLTPSASKNDAVFDDPLGNYLSQSDVLIGDHVLAVQGALGLTAGEIDRILRDGVADGRVHPRAEQPSTAELTLATVSLLYRYGLLAGALGLSVHELIVLKELAGIDPFEPLHDRPLTAARNDHLWVKTLRFVEIVESVRQSGFTVEGLDYLLRHRFAETGKYRPQRDAVLALLETLSEPVRAIRAEHAVPVEPGAMGQDELRKKLELALPSEVVARFLTMLDGTVELTATKLDVKLPLKPELFKDEPAVRALSYDPARREQKLTLRGVLLKPEKDRLKALAPSQDLSDLLDDLERQSRSFFDNQLLKQKLRLEGEAGFLDDGDFAALFAPLELDPAKRQAQLKERRDRVAHAFLPWLQQRSIRQLVVQAMAAQTGADPALVESLLTDARLLADGQPVPQPLLESLAAAGERGLTVTFSGPTGVAPGSSTFADADTGLRDEQGQPRRPAQADGARFEGYLEVPATGAYRFFIGLDKEHAEAELLFDHLPNPAFLNHAATRDADEIDAHLELKSGVPYRFTLLLRKLNGGEARLRVQGATLPKGSLAQLSLYPREAIERGEHALVLLTKVLHLIQGLGLTQREVRHLLAPTAGSDTLDLSQLPTRRTDDSPAEAAKAAARFGQMLRLFDYARLKRGPARGTDDLIGVFERARYTHEGMADEAAKTAHFEPLAQLTGRDAATVRATFEGLGFAIQVTEVKPRGAGPSWLVETSELADEKGVGRLWEALQIVERLGIAPKAVLEATAIVSPEVGGTSPSPKLAIARNLRNTVKARYEPEEWRRIARPIFDGLRQLQRDALVAYIMEQEGFERAEQLFEHFLIDPGMEPVVQTSRLRLAISSVQLFIQRCLLNLEKRVHPSAINSAHWQWMKRYRVWEANRNIFLFPESWLEPEFRDDKTHLYQELEGALLQGDVSNDLAENALFQYLRKLEELARLDVVTMYYEEKPDPASDVLHVIGRTHNVPHKYFYRRHAHHMWTPWEPVTTQIEGDHVVAVVWRQRLHLFWVTFLKKPKQAAAPPAVKLVFNEALALPATVPMEVEVVLSWSEHFQGQWTAPESSGAGNPLRVEVADDFDSSKVFIYVSKKLAGAEDSVKINLTSPSFASPPVRPPVSSPSGGPPPGQAPERPRTGFLVESKNSRPEITEIEFALTPPYDVGVTQATATRYKVSGLLKGTFATREILGQERTFSLLTVNYDVNNASRTSASLTPFFFLDHEHTFFVEPSLVEVPVTLHEKFGVDVPHEERRIDHWEETPVKVEVPVLAEGFQHDPHARFAMQVNDDWLTAPGALFGFDEHLVGRDGGLDSPAPANR